MCIMHCKIRLNKRVIWDLCSTWEGRMLSVCSNPLQRGGWMPAALLGQARPLCLVLAFLPICSSNQIRVTMLYILLV